ncbi:hypothetical protein TrVE_jg9672 [Triparma verrucosa]|uniref:PH domain-containing protein n=2 Tax=Triparma TaxID=722752 RepID=A0A9W6ZJQ8_9STRA|nr:hypothetical protein TrST_g11593 [Triparma strigata]GMH91167.1 hypothetical protein TrVE_jg9672 [Triparma verrucosa]|mmetsp:Transcript_11733/g.21380  ORF Transcript_11733/g.21380 Transcript_11733/m.21380 type:complete len:120 (-) Transcript_11733:124-483(-)
MSDRQSNRFDCVRVEPGEIHKQGYLTKLGGAHDGKQGNWKRRYMVLKDDLFYYEDETHFEKGRDPKGIIRLDSFFCIKKDGENPDNEFTIFAVPKPLICHADTKEELNSWVKTIARFGR